MKTVPRKKVFKASFSTVFKSFKKSLDKLIEMEHVNDEDKEMLERIKKNVIDDYVKKSL